MIDSHVTFWKRDMMVSWLLSKKQYVVAVVTDSVMMTGFLASRTVLVSSWYVQR